MTFFSLMDWPVEAVIRSSLMDTVTNSGDLSPAEEICGALLGKKDKDIWKITEVIFLTNISHNKSMHYIPDPNEWIKVISDTTFLNEEADKDLIGIFHTHPNSKPIASTVDIEEAGYEGVYWIYSPKFKESKFYYYDGDEDNRQFKQITYNRS